MTRPVPNVARRLAAQLDALFGQDAALARRLADAQERLERANDRLWWGVHPDGLAAVYGEHPAAIQAAFVGNRSEVVGGPNPLVAAQQVHWSIHSAFRSYQAAAEQRRQLAADIGEVIRQLVDALVAGGWSEEQARNTDVHEIATSKSANLGAEDENDTDTAVRNRGRRQHVSSVRLRAR